jgi:signal transduction histidine kinase
MKRKGSLLIVLLFLYNIHGTSQDVKLKESYNAYRNEKSDSLRIEKHVAYFYILLNDNSKQKEAVQELALIKKELELFPIPSFTPAIYRYEGTLAYRQGDYINSIIFFERALKILPQRSKVEIQTLGNAYTSLGLSYSMINDWENAQLNYQKSIGKLEQAGDSSSVSLTYMNMAYIFLDVEDWHNATISLNKSAAYLNAASDKEYAAEIYASLSRSFSKAGDLQQARRYLVTADSIIRLQGADASKTFYYLAEGEYFFYRNEFERAVQCNVKGLGFARSWGDSAFVAVLLENLGAAYLGEKDYSSALQSFDASKSIAENNNFLPQKTKILKLMFRLYRETGQLNEAVQVSGNLMELTDSLSLTLNNNRRIIMDAVFDSDKKEKRITALETERQKQLLKIYRKNTLNYILIASAATLLLISLLTYRNYKQKQKIQQQRINELETKQQLTATEAVLKGEEQERTRIAKDLHDGLGGMLSGIKFSFNTMKGNLIMTPENKQAFERSMDMLDSSIKEMRRVAHNMMPEVLVNFGLDTALNDLCNDISKSGALKVAYQSLGLENAKIEQTTSIAIYRIVQELLNNTMKHAAATTAIVQVSRSENQLTITVEDDGNGFDTAILQHTQGIGWSNIQNRVEFLKGSLDVRSGNKAGTSVHIEINL